jgi:FkbM family methyltransferase
VIEAAPPWGALAPNALERTILAATQAAPPRGLQRTLASAARGVMVAWRRGPVDVEVYGFKARLHHAENLADKRALFYPTHWDATERAILAELIRPGFRFLDVGASTGLYSMFVAARAGADALILAVEPQPEVKDWLGFNIAANGFTTIRHVAAAAAAGRGTAMLTLSARNRGAASIAQNRETSGERAIEVPTIGLLDLMDEHGVARADALKIDIEGAEDLVLVPFFEACPKDRLPGAIVMESNGPRWRVDCVELARRSGYVVRATTRMNTVLSRDPA